MTHEDPLIRLLHAADAARSEPAPQADLAERAYAGARRKEARSRVLRRTALGTGAAAAMLLAFLAYRGGTSDRQFGQAPVAVDDSVEIAQLRAEAEAFGAQADSLDRELRLARNESARQELLDEYRRQNAFQVVAELTPSASDRAAEIVLREADYYRQVLEDRAAAGGAYAAVIADFRDTPSAAVARQRLKELYIN